jgi:hypothetical protein
VIHGFAALEPDGYPRLVIPSYCFAHRGQVSFGDLPLVFLGPNDPRPRRISRIIHAIRNVVDGGQPSACSVYNMGAINIEGFS